MMEMVFFFLLYTAVLLFGVLLSYAFAGIPFFQPKRWRSPAVTFLVETVL